MPTSQEKLFAAALRLFNEVGFERTPTSRIAAEAGVAVGTLFHHFSTKEDLINALFLSCKNDWVDALRMDFSEARDLRGRIRILFLRSLSWGVEHADAFQFIVQYHQSTHIRAGTLEAARRRFEPLIQLLAADMGQTSFKPLPMELQVLVAWNLITLFTSHVLEHPQLATDSVFLETAFETLWDALQANSA